MQASLDAEAKGKAEAMRMKKKLEQDINELEVACDSANRARAEMEKNVKKYQQQARGCFCVCMSFFILLLVREMQAQIEEEQRNREELREALGSTERRANILGVELEEFRANLEQAERIRKIAEAERTEAADRVTELAAQAASFLAHKRKLEADLAAMQVSYG
ncbi:unnamed protein product [Protopolystoma xenopodis]|uniref:Myosin tail domain-containing protein n=1 Tax=Protopolystoma xenopodis TaxID=117903 RepID=A0A448X0E8_9PLAT|nr:unnamed protein product [Protopolystoma xenopodis]